ncbi:MAG: UDP-N-acetylmuramate dehydrogenase [Lachnospiraceae bacterium]|nr:UDP-N-acetylmuramate dehydrogenase [Lachnospiraceae bacterium]
MLEKLQKLIGEEKVLVNEPMASHTTFRIGGPADYFVMPETIEELAAVLKLCKEEAVPYFILGNGSNLLVGDKGFRGVVIQLYKNFDGIQIEGTKVTAKAGAMLIRVAKEAGKAGLTGLEFASGIPGTIGGAMVMNAGAYGGEMKDVVTAVTVLTKDGDIKTLSGEDMNFRYRGSVVEDEGHIVLEAVMELQEGNLEEIQARIDELSVQRRTKQPIEYPSAGSTFKRPEGYFAGKLIQDAGLRGYQVGGAQVSEKHCGFVINVGGATAADVMQLMQDVSDKVNEQFGVILEPEVKRIGEF